MAQSSDTKTRARYPNEADSGPGADGRSARRDRNRLAVIDAAIELFSEGNLRPTATEIASRCALSPKSVSRYFEDIDSLIAAAAARQMELVFSLFQIHAIGQGPLKRRIDVFVQVRLKAHEVMGGTSRAADFLAFKQPAVRKHLDEAQRLARSQIGRHFATELDPLPSAKRESRTAAIDALLQFDSLDYFRQHRRFTFSVTHAILVDALALLLGE
jgi:TetR/AcrR family transcriptional regulator, regulator of autoinduction and epiphytic fitness